MKNWIKAFGITIFFTFVVIGGVTSLYFLANFIHGWVDYLNIMYSNLGNKLGVTILFGFIIFMVTAWVKANFLDESESIDYFDSF